MYVDVVATNCFSHRHLLSEVSSVQNRKTLSCLGHLTQICFCLGPDNSGLRPVRSPKMVRVESAFQYSEFVCSQELPMVGKVDSV